MWRYAIALSVLTILLVPNWASAQFQQGDWELTLSGSGSNDKDFDSGDAALQGSIGNFVTDQLEVGLRQAIIWADGGSAWAGSTRAAADFHFDLGRWQPLVGASAGYQYGETVEDEWVGGPEAGVKFFANATTFVQFLIGYDFEICNGFDTGGFVYTLGVGFKF